MDYVGAAHTLLGQKAVARPASGEPTPGIWGPSGVVQKQMPRNAKGYMAGFGGENASDWAADAGDYWASTVASAPVHFERGGQRLKMPDDAEGDYAGDAPADLVSLFLSPNPFQTMEDLLYLATIDLLFAGEFFFLKYQMNAEGQPLALYRLHPAHIDILPGAIRPVDVYEYRVDGVPTPQRYRPEEIIHFKLPNPNSTTRGMGIIQRGPRVYDQDMALVETMAQFFEHGAKLSGVLQSDRSVPEPLHKKIQRQFASLYSGSRNAYKVAVLERGLTFQSIQPTAADAQFDTLSGMGRDRIFAMFGMHPSLINADTARPGLLDEAQRHFDEKHMRPFLDRLQTGLTAQLVSAWGLTLCIDYEYVMPEKDRLTLAAVYGTLPGVKVIEVRKYVGLPPLGDKRDEIVLNLPGLGVQDGGSPTGAVPGPEGGRPPNPNNLTAFPGGPQGEQPDARYAAQDGKSVASPELSDQVVDVLSKYRHAPKSERADAVGELAAVDWPSDSRPLRGRIVSHVTEGIRRGYSVDQILDGHPEEEFAGIRDVLLEGVLARAA